MSAGELAGGTGECLFSVVWCGSAEVRQAAALVESVEGLGRVAVRRGRMWVLVLGMGGERMGGDTLPFGAPLACQWHICAAADIK